MDITIDDNRNVYVVSDIHNYADGFKRLLKKIQFNENDLLIIDGDIFNSFAKRCTLNGNDIIFRSLLCTEGLTKTSKAN